MSHTECAESLNKRADEKKTKKPKPPRRLDGSKKGELLKWVEGMDPCKCGGKHLYRECPDPKTNTCEIHTCTRYTC
jgi:hypothetical protein